tara:strand:+ start:141 stop:614 length:474 start_codon:yes stop_codon:yes gene_type:complete
MGKGHTYYERRVNKAGEPVYVSVRRPVMPDPTDEELIREKEGREARDYREQDEIHAYDVMQARKAAKSPSIGFFEGPSGETEASMMSQFRNEQDYKETFDANLKAHLQRFKDEGTLPVMYPGSAWNFTTRTGRPSASQLAVYESLQEAYRLKDEGKI